MRTLIKSVAQADPTIGSVREERAWGQPSFRTPHKGIGTAVRLGRSKSGIPHLYVHCQTTLIADFRAKWGDDFAYDGNRGLAVTDPNDPRIADFIHSVLSYRLR
ncbi:DUF1801 domain-containing protein [Pontivivens insulae]|uniref:DUF1801 domain-containing protein n=1 Tax=Pontivivens insulae TaxID=1639689 RepID=UPI0011C06C75|nr:DUF1801 domain-containing protein [Pontivivens insulae]